MDSGSVEAEVETDTDTRTQTDEVVAHDGDVRSRGRLAGLRQRVPSPRLPRSRRSLFSPAAFGTALLLGAAAMLLGTLVPLPASRFVLLFVATFAYGAVGDTARYAECVVAGAAAGTVGFLLSVALGGALLPVLGGFGAEIAGIGVGAGALAALAGHYFGRDLRAGWVD
jgi:hypothetical protein